jgi:DNA-binding transcriptional ArsR family regulator
LQASLSDGGPDQRIDVTALPLGATGAEEADEDQNLASHGRETPELGRSGRKVSGVDSEAPGIIVKGVLNQSASLDLVFQALADPTRRVMVERLTRGPASVSELAEPLEMTLSAVVQHLAVLETSGLVRSEKVGRVRTCRVETKVLRTAEHWITERRTTWERRLDRLGDFLAEQPEHPPAPSKKRSKS